MSTSNCQPRSSIICIAEITNDETSGYSTSLVFLCVYGSQTVDAYARMGLARVSQHCVLVFLGQLERFPLRKAKLLLAIFVVVSSCWFHDNFSEVQMYTVFIYVWPWMV